jgi:hypothetical protein
MSARRTLWGARGAITTSVAGDPTLCTRGKKCVRKDGHAGDCWPKDVPDDMHSSDPALD